MGVQDKLWVKLTCQSCGNSETSSASDYGSGWSGSKWGGINQFEKFTVVCHGGGAEEPEVVSATCKECGGAASIKNAYGFGTPSGF